MGNFSIVVILGLGALGQAANAQTLTFVRYFSNAMPVADVTGETLDATGVYIAGGLRNGQTLGMNLDAYVRKTDPTGQELWVRRLGGAAIINAIAPASGGGVYIAGQTGWNIVSQAYYSLPGQTPLGFTDAFVRRYDGNGNELWTLQFGTANYDYIYGAAVDSSGLYIVGNLGMASPYTFPSGQPFLRKYDPAGNVVWNVNLDVADARHIVSDGTEVYVTGRFNWANNTYQPFLRKFDSSGDELWTQQTDIDFPSGMAANSAGVFFSVGQSLLRYDPNGNLLWTNSTQSGGPLAVDKAGVYGVGPYDAPGQCASGSGDAVVARFDLDGNRIWLRQFEAGGSASALAADATGVFAAGGGTNTFLARLEAEPAPPVTGKPQIRNECVLNAASFFGGGATPGEIVTILGSGIGPVQPTSQTAPVGGQLPTSLSGTRVLFNGIAAPLMYVSDGQINAVTPAALNGASVDVQVEYNGAASGALTVPIRGPRFAVFQDQPGLIVMNADGSRNSPSNPAARGSVITVYGTGAGVTNPSIADGRILDATSAASLSLATKAHFEKFDAAGNVLGQWDSSATLQGVPGSVYGMFQVSMTVPSDLGLNIFCDLEPPWVFLDLGVVLASVWVR